MIVKALVSYDGFNYAGWQKQENALGIQQVIEEALYKITKENVDEMYEKLDKILSEVQ